MRSLARYFNKWHIKINAEKTQFLFVPFSGHKKRLPSPGCSVRIEGLTIARSDVIKYLGILYDKKFNFIAQASAAKQKTERASRALFPLYASSDMIRKHKLALIRQVLLPILTYALPAWHTISASQKKGGQSDTPKGRQSRPQTAVQNADQRAVRQSAKHTTHRRAIRGRPAGIRGASVCKFGQPRDAARVDPLSIIERPRRTHSITLTHTHHVATAAATDALPCSPSNCLQQYLFIHPYSPCFQIFQFTLHCINFHVSLQHINLIIPVKSFI